MACDGCKGRHSPFVGSAGLPLYIIGTEAHFCCLNRCQTLLLFVALQRRWGCYFAVQEAAMYRRLLSILAISLSMTACVPYYSGSPGYYRSEVYTAPVYYDGGYRPYYVYPRSYYAPPPRYYQGSRYYPVPQGYYRERGYRPGHRPGYGGDPGRDWGWRGR